MGRRLCAAGAAIGRRVWERPRRPGPRRRAAARAYIGLARGGPGRASPGRLALPVPLRSAPLANRLPSARHGPKYRGGRDAQSQGEKQTAEAGGGEDASGPHQQQHRAAEAAAGAGVRAAPAQLQAGEGRHPRDGCQLPEAQQSLRRRCRSQEPAPGLQRGLLVVPARGCAVPDPARRQRHADEAALSLPAAPSSHRTCQGAADAGRCYPPHALPGQSRCRHFPPTSLRPLAALVTPRPTGAWSGSEDRQAGSSRSSRCREDLPQPQFSPRLAATFF